MEDTARELFQCALPEHQVHETHYKWKGTDILSDKSTVLFTGPVDGDFNVAQLFPGFQEELQKWKGKPEEKKEGERINVCPADGANRALEEFVAENRLALQVELQLNSTSSWAYLKKTGMVRWMTF